jgi:hypothetical protein
MGGLTVNVTVRPSGHANSSHQSGEGHHSTVWWNSGFLQSRSILHGFHAAAGIHPVRTPRAKPRIPKITISGLQCKMG